MGNQELLDYFSAYHAVKARHSYGLQGHRGMSVLIVGLSGSLLMFYAFCTWIGKSGVKFEMRSYQEMKQMSEDNQQLAWYKSKVAKEQRHSKALEESLNIVSEKLCKTSEQNRIVRHRTKMQTEQNKEEMVFQEQFFEGQIRKINEAAAAKEDDFEKRPQDERKKVEQYTASASTVEDQEHR